MRRLLVGFLRSWLHYHLGFRISTSNLVFYDQSQKFKGYLYYRQMGLQNLGTKWPKEVLQAKKDVH